MKAYQAQGGTNRPGIPKAAFAMPAGMRMRYDAPAPDLTGCVSGYAAYISDFHDQEMVNWFLPAPAQISVLLDAGPVDVVMRSRQYQDIAQVSLYGPTTRAFKTVTRGGMAVGIGLSPLGWRRLIARPADEYRDRIVPLSQVIDPAAVERLVADLSALEDDAHFAPVMDQWVRDLRGPEHPEDVELQRLTGLMVTDDIINVADAIERLGIAPRLLRRMAAHHFGMPPKMLLSRARFMRSVTRWLMTGEPPSYEGIDGSYFDLAHFLRDARIYLGTTPRRFTRLPTGYLKASLMARMAVLGAPTYALHQPVPEEPVGSGRPDGSTDTITNSADAD